jgi:hypothetical protein
LSIVGMSTLRSGTILDLADVLLGMFHCWETIDELLPALSDAQWRGDRIAGLAGAGCGRPLDRYQSMLLGIKTPDPDIDVSALPHVHNDAGTLSDAGSGTFGTDRAASS